MTYELYLLIDIAAVEQLHSVISNLDRADAASCRSPQTGR